MRPSGKVKRMTAEGISHLDWAAELQCQLGETGRGHSERATVTFVFRCITADCEAHPKGPVRQGFAMCTACALQARKHGLDCTRCGQFYRWGTWEWNKAVDVSAIRGSSGTFEPVQDEPGGLGR